MGAWGLGSFENDAALDWVGELRGARSLAPVRRALRRPLGSGAAYLELDDACAALAAAEVVAALNLAPLARLPESVEEWVNTRPLAVDQELLDLALGAVARVRADSELRDLVEEDERNAAQWRADVADLESRLRRPPNAEAVRVLRERAVVVRRARARERATRPRPRVGDLLWAPIEEGRGAALIVLHLYKAHWKFAMHVGVFAGRTFSSAEEVRVDLLEPPCLVPTPFTYVDAITRREWPIVGHAPELTRHFELPVVGGGTSHHMTRGDIVVGRYGPPLPDCAVPGCAEAPEVTREELRASAGEVFSPTKAFATHLRRIFGGRLA